MTNSCSAIKTELEYAARQTNRVRFGSIFHKYQEYLCGAPPTFTFPNIYIRLDTKTLSPTQNCIANEMGPVRIVSDIVYECLVLNVQDKAY